MILIIDGWLANAGDAAILLAMQSSLTRAIPGARVVFCAHHRELVGDRYPTLELAAPLEVLADVTWPWTSERDRVERGVLEDLVDKADLLIVPGGGFLFEHYRPEGRLATYEMLLERGARLAFYAQSIGEFSDRGLRDRLSSILRAASLVLVRERSSFDAVRELCDLTTLYVTADEAVLLPKRRSPPLRRRRALLATVSSHPWWTRSSGVRQLDDADVQGVADSLSGMLRERQFKSITFASTVQGLGGERWALEDDAITAAAVRAAMPPSLAERVTVIPGYLSAHQYAALAARHAAVVSMRMHGALLAATVRTPVLLANGSEKARGLATGFSVTTDLRRIGERLGRLDQSRADWRAGQDEAIGAMRRQAAQNARLVAELL
ncbi:MAG TPA: polysaccharide pyruvyl transferase family protein [Candidatus Dormibacteraeota bacterium]|nr:polysaccharide pyruvyl transferase family protein [Candidatus Dormibacteraeota bacterium]